MLVLDNFFPKDLINAVILEANEQQWGFFRSDANQDFYWTKSIFGDTYFNTNETIEKFTSENVKKCWEFFKNKLNCDLKDSNLESIYFNGLTYGVESHAHTDSSDLENLTTVIIYVCENWNSYWGGETVFFNGGFNENPADNIFYSHDITKSVLPRYNRIVLFDGKIVHAVRPISKNFKGLRKTLMFKIKNWDFKNLCS